METQRCDECHRSYSENTFKRQSLQCGHDKCRVCYFNNSGKCIQCQHTSSDLNISGITPIRETCAGGQKRTPTPNSKSMLFASPLSKRPLTSTPQKPHTSTSEHEADPSKRDNRRKLLFSDVGAQRSNVIGDKDKVYQMWKL